LSISLTMRKDCLLICYALKAVLGECSAQVWRMILGADDCKRSNY